MEAKHSSNKLRETDYAVELARATLEGSDSRLERLRIKETGVEEIRFSWWPNGKIAQRPLDLPEDELLSLIQAGFANEVLSQDFRQKLKAIL